VHPLSSESIDSLEILQAESRPCKSGIAIDPRLDRTEAGGSQGEHQQRPPASGDDRVATFRLNGGREGGVAGNPQGR
jgi:hypothetical protein